MTRKEMKQWVDSLTQQRQSVLPKKKTATKKSKELAAKRNRHWLNQTFKDDWEL